MRERARERAKRRLTRTRMTTNGDSTKEDVSNKKTNNNKGKILRRSGVFYEDIYGGLNEVE